MIQRASWLAWILILVSPAAVQACTCSQAAPGACAGLQKDDVVFLGTVTSIETIPPSAAAAAANASESTNVSPGDSSQPAASSNRSDAEETPVLRYRFHIDEKFAGSNDPEIEIYSGGDDGDCAYRFQEGQQYVVYTQQETEGRLFATICNGTRLSSDARALIPQLRALRNGQRVASVFGILRRTDPPFLAPPDDPADPLPNIPLKLRSSDDRFSTSTGPNGVYSFYDVHAGEYRFTATLPARMEMTRKTLSGGLPPFKIPNGACYEYDVDALPTGHIRGSVLGPDGKPLKLASVELYRAGQYEQSRPGLWGFQGSSGVFDFDHVGPGQYILVFNRANRVDPNTPFPRLFYPGELDQNKARPIELKDGQQLSKVNIKLSHGFPTRRVRVRVKWERLRPAGNVTVMAKADDGLNPAAEKIADDLYEFTLLQSGHYTLSAWEDLDPSKAAPGRKESTCTVPARIDTAVVPVDNSDSNTKEIVLGFHDPGCAPQ